MQLCVIGMSLVTAGTSLAGLPTYEFELQARTNFSVNPGSSWNIPANHFFSGEDIQLNDSRHISFHVSVTPSDQPKVWFGDAATGGIVYTAAVDAFLSETSLNNNDRVIWDESFVTTEGIYYYDDMTSGSGFLTNRPFGTTTWTAAVVNDANQVGFRAGFSFNGDAYISWDPTAPTSHAEHVVETGLDPGSPWAFLFTPDFNNNRQIAGKGRIGSTSGSAPDEIRIWNSDGTSILIAEDDDGNPASQFTGFDNSVALNDNGWVAFVANLAGNVRGVFASDGTTTVTIATEAHPDVSDIEFFAPDMNNDGLVVFRAFNASGQRAIWVGDGTDLMPLVTEHDILPTDLGDGRVDQNTTSSPVFGGAPCVNNNGDVAFYCGLTPPDDDQIEWGSGVYVAKVIPAVCPGDATGDLMVNFDDLNEVLTNWGTGGPDGDVFPEGGDGMVNFDDLNEVLTNWNTDCN